MFTHYRTQGFILKKTDSGDFDRIFTIYTKDFGKLEFLAKAERKIKSKLRGALEVFYLSEIEFIQGKGRRTLTDAILINNFSNLRKSLKRLAVAFKISEVLDGLVRGQEPDAKLWQLFADVFENLNNSRFRYDKYQLLYYFFLWNILSFLGYQPELFHCSLCQKKLTPADLYFSGKDGGLICQNCPKSVKSVRETDLATIKILRLIIKNDWPTVAKLKINQSHLRFLSIISKDYYSYISNNL